jgi:hypothetical protein
LALKEAVGGVERLRGRFELPVNPGELHLSRTHPVVEALATHVLDTALDPQSKAIARRSGVIRTSQVSKRTTLLLLRARYHLVTRRGDEERPQLAEDCLLAAFAGSPQAPEWLDPAAAEKLLAAQPEGNIGPDQATDALRKILDGFDLLLPQLEALAVRHGSEVLEAHQRVRRAAALKGVTHRVEPQLPPDVLGVYVYLPRVG